MSKDESRPNYLHQFRAYIPVATFASTISVSAARMVWFFGPGNPGQIVYASYTPLPISPMRKEGWQKQDFDDKIAPLMQLCIHIRKLLQLIISCLCGSVLALSSPWPAWSPGMHCNADRAARKHAGTPVPRHYHSRGIGR